MQRSTGRVIALAIAVTSITLGHYTTSLYLRQVHDLYLRLYYVPIIFAGFWFGFRGGLITATSVSALLAPHVLFQWRHMPLTDADQYLEMIVYVVVGGVTGALSQREAQRRDDLRSANGKIEMAYAQLRKQSLALVEADEQLRRAERLAIVGEFSATMAHEIRNPLGSIKGAAEIFRDSLGPGHKLNEFAQILVKEADHLNRYLTNFLDFARPKDALVSGSDVREAVDHVLHLTRERSRQKEILIEAEVEADVPMAAIPPDALRQVLLNLVLNGMEALSGAGRIAISASVAAPGDGVESSNARRIVRIAVTDEGPGIAPEARGRIFEPFFTTKPGGTGLGLAICQRTVIGYGGSIRVHDVEPHGTRFTVDLPPTLEVETT